MRRDWPSILKDAKERGLGIRPLAREIGCDSGAVYQQCKRHGIQLPKPIVTLPPTIVALYVATPDVEQWRPIPWTDGLFEASSEGRIRDARTGEIRPPRATNRGYLWASVRMNGKAKAEKVHRLVGWAFVSNVYGKPYVNHKDFDKSNNRPGNLEWMTFDENFEHGKAARRAFAAYNPNVPHKITPAQVVRLREMAANGFSPEELGAHFGCSASHAYNIAIGKKRVHG